MVGDELLWIEGEPVEGLGVEDVEEVLRRLDDHRPLVLGFRAPPEDGHDAYDPPPAHPDAPGRGRHGRVVVSYRT